MLAHTGRMTRRRLLSALQFFPRGGSSHVARAFARELPSHGWDVTVVSGSRRDLEGVGDAARFYAGLDVYPVSFDEALASPDPLDPPPGFAPIQPSYEDRPGAPDRVFAMLDDDAYERQVKAWARALTLVGAAGFDALHLHHLTPIHEAAARVAPAVPIIGHLHGTELLMLEAIAPAHPRAGRTPELGSNECAAGRWGATDSSLSPRQRSHALSGCSAWIRTGWWCCPMGSTRASSSGATSTRVAPPRCARRSAARLVCGQASRQRPLPARGRFDTR